MVLSSYAKYRITSAAQGGQLADVWLPFHSSDDDADDDDDPKVVAAG